MSQFSHDQPISIGIRATFGRKSTFEGLFHFMEIKDDKIKLYIKTEFYLPAAGRAYFFQPHLE